MNFTTIFRKFIPTRWQRTSKDEPLSIVLLLRKPHFFTSDELQLAAERAWHVSFAGGNSSKHCVAQAGKATLLKAGPHLISFFHFPGPYIENPKGNADWLPRSIQRHAWTEHSACVGVDYLNRNADVELGFCVLSGLVAEMIDGNCTGIYMPRESSLIPNDGDLYLELRKRASSRESGVTDGLTSDQLGIKP